MGRAERNRPKRLGQKLETIRKELGIETFDEMIKAFNHSEASLHRDQTYRATKKANESLR